MESWKRWGCWIDITPDGGRTWIKSNPINIKDDFFGVIQPSFFQTQDEIKALMRSRSSGYVYITTSTDQGTTWSEATPTDLPNPNAAVEALTLKDGSALLVFNDSKVNRYPLSIALSSDGGTSWKRTLTLEDQEGEFSYPAAIQTSDGLVHITYTYNRVKIKHVVLDPKLL
jgi:predicted neuraminidase